MTLKEIYNLNLPEAPDFVSEQPEISLSDMIAMCEKMLPHWNAIRYSKPEAEFMGEAFTLEPQSISSLDTPKK